MKINCNFNKKNIEKISSYRVSACDEALWVKDPKYMMFQF